MSNIEEIFESSEVKSGNEILLDAHVSELRRQNIHEPCQKTFMELED